ncbi:hypothetical protein BJV82DRAFT_610627 [Fennellomyces sp. T-0311]|nr:hypothetical protein BJV82DRAFT_610627 [Fennellomyces sp. T-0311]
MLIADYTDVNFSSVSGSNPDHDTMTSSHSQQDLADGVIGFSDTFYDCSAIESNEEFSIIWDLFSTAAFAEPSLVSASEENTSYQAFVAPDMLQQQNGSSTVSDDIPDVKIAPAPRVDELKRTKAVKRKSSLMDDYPDNEGRRQRRLLRNRIAAKECREKKKQHIQTLTKRIQQLETENEQLREQLRELNEKLDRFSQMNDTHLA